MSNQLSLPALNSPAPDFSANSTHGHINLHDYKGKWIILFSHPGDFTPVCTTEYMAFEKARTYFEEKNAQLLGLSIDSNASHIAWLINIFKNSTVKVGFPVIEDRNMTISRLFGMVDSESPNPANSRAVFFIDPEQTVRAIIYYPFSTGRNIAEILRELDALQFHDANNMVTPANWVPGRAAIELPPATFETALAKSNGPNCLDWYLCYNLNEPR